MTWVKHGEKKEEEVPTNSAQDKQELKDEDLAIASKQCENQQSGSATNDAVDTVKEGTDKPVDDTKEKVSTTSKAEEKTATTKLESVSSTETKSPSIKESSTKVLPKRKTNFDFSGLSKLVKSYKLVIVLREESKAVESQQKEFARSFSFLQSKESEKSFTYVIDISYGSGVIVSEPVLISKYDFNKRHLEVLSESECKLYDALAKLKEVTDKYYRKSVRTDGCERYFDIIEIIGFGTASDNQSVTTKAEAYECYQKAANFKSTKSKYFSNDEFGAVRAASIGFHSIGSGDRVWK